MIQHQMWEEDTVPCQSLQAHRATSFHRVHNESVFKLPMSDAHRAMSFHRAHSESVYKLPLWEVHNHLLDSKIVQHYMSPDKTDAHVDVFQMKQDNPQRSVLEDYRVGALPIAKCPHHHLQPLAHWLGDLTI